MAQTGVDLALVEDLEGDPGTAQQRLGFLERGSPGDRLVGDQQNPGHAQPFCEVADLTEGIDAMHQFRGHEVESAHLVIVLSVRVLAKPPTRDRLSTLPVPVATSLQKFRP